MNEPEKAVCLADATGGEPGQPDGGKNGHAGRPGAGG